MGGLRRLVDEAEGDGGGLDLSLVVAIRWMRMWEWGSGGLSYYQSSYQ